MATNVFGSMINEGLEPTAHVFNALIYVCLSSQDFMRARNLFEIMISSDTYQPNSDTYNSFILSYLKLGNLEKMYDWYSSKAAAGFSSDFQTHQLLILEAIKLSKPTYAHKYFKGMVSQGIMPDIDTLQPLLHCLSNARRVGNVAELVKSILNGGWEINVDMAKKLVWFYSAPHCKEVMEQLVLYVTESNQALEVQSLFHLGLIRMYTKEKLVDDIEICVARMLKQGLSFTCSDDVEEIIYAYFIKAAYDHRLDLFLESIKGSYTLTRSTYVVLVACYRLVGVYDKWAKVVNEMKLAGLA